MSKTILIKSGTKIYDSSSNKFTLSKDTKFNVIKEDTKYFFFNISNSAEYRVEKKDVTDIISTNTKVTNISENITYNEAVRSQTAKQYNINNTPNQKQITNMMLLAENIFQPIRKHFKTPISITSFFRSVTLNKKIGGSQTSQHCKGEAMDLDADVYGGISNKQIFDFIKTYLDYDQLIWEFGDETNPNWVHVSYTQTGNRNLPLISKFKDGKTTYDLYSEDSLENNES